ncbi:Spx/MgsR family RNA polymerase-binding regulatory protein [Aliikangiella sp. IMCC44653]
MPQDLKMFGIKNCDTVKKAKKWLESHKIEFEFFDFKTVQLTPQQVNIWLEEVGAEKLINKRGTTWRQLTDAQKNNQDNDFLVQLIIDKPALIKRPLISFNHQFDVGFKVQDWEAKFLAN